MNEENKEEHKKVGRPTILNDELKAKARTYIDECEDEITDYHKTKGEKSDSFERIVKVDLPSIEGLAFYLKVHKDTLYDWEKKDEEFSDLMNDLRAKQAKTLINKGLSGDYNPTIAKVLLTKHGYREGIDNTTNDKDIPAPILSLPKE